MAGRVNEKSMQEYQEAIYSDTIYPIDLRPQESRGYQITYVCKDL